MKIWGLCLAFVLGACDSDDNLAAVQQSWTLRFNGIEYDDNPADGCALNEIRTMRFQFFDQNSGAFARELNPFCAAGQLDTYPDAVIRKGSYRLKIEGLNEQNQVTKSVVSADQDLAKVDIVHSYQTLFPGVIDISGFQPKGTDWILDATWRVSTSTTGTMAEHCAARGAAKVRFIFVRTDEDPKVDESVMMDEAPCANDATGTGLDARGNYKSSKRIVARGVYKAYGTLVRSDGSVISESNKIEADFTQAKNLDIVLTN